jgi:hypothetical protein
MVNHPLTESDESPRSQGLLAPSNRGPVAPEAPGLNHSHNCSRELLFTASAAAHWQEIASNCPSELFGQEQRQLKHCGSCPT